MVKKERLYQGPKVRYDIPHSRHIAYSFKSRLTSILDNTKRPWVHHKIQQARDMQDHHRQNIRYAAANRGFLSRCDG